MKDCGLLKPLCAMNAIVKNEHIYMVDKDTWLFLDYNLSNHNYSIVADLSNEPKEYNCTIQKIIEYENEFWFIQRKSKELISLSNKNYIKRYYAGERVDKYHLYYEACISDNKIYMLPMYTSGNISIFDIDSKCFIHEIALSVVMSKYGLDFFNGEISYLFDNTGNFVKFCINGGNMLYKLELKSLSLSVEFLGKNTLGSIGGNYEFPMVSLYQSNIYMVKNGKWIEKRPIVQFVNKENTEYDIAFLIKYGNKEFIMSNSFDSLVEVDSKGECVGTFYLPNDIEVSNDRNTSWLYSCCIQNERKLFFIPCKVNKMVIFDMDTEKFEKHSIIISNVDLYKINRFCKKGIAIREGGDISIKSLLRKILS